MSEWCQFESNKQEIQFTHKDEQTIIRFPLVPRVGEHVWLDFENGDLAEAQRYVVKDVDYSIGPHYKDNMQISIEVELYVFAEPSLR